MPNTGMHTFSHVMHLSQDATKSDKVCYVHELVLRFRPWVPPDDETESGPKEYDMGREYAASLRLVAGPTRGKKRRVWITLSTLPSDGYSKSYEYAGTIVDEKYEVIVERGERVLFKFSETSVPGCSKSGCGCRATLLPRLVIAVLWQADSNNITFTPHMGVPAAAMQLLSLNDGCDVVGESQLAKARTEHKGLYPEQPPPPPKPPAPKKRPGKPTPPHAKKAKAVEDSDSESESEVGAPILPPPLSD